MTKSTHDWLAWATPVLATITAILDAGHLAHLIPSEVSVLIFAIITALVGFIAAGGKVEEQHLPQPVQQK